MATDLPQNVPQASDVPLERRVRDLESILSITRAMAAQTDLTKLLVMLAASCSKVLQVERSTIWVVDAGSGDLFSRVAEKMDALHVPKGKGIVGAVAADGEMLLIPDAYADSRFNPEVDKKSGFKTRDILCLPLKDVEGTRVVGVLQALNKAGGGLNSYDVELASLIAAQVGVVLDQAALREQANEKKRLQAELDLAHTIQQRLLPHQSPDVPGLDISGVNIPATETSGDYFDYVTLADGRLGVIVADVTGHGLGAALVMTAARAFIRALSITEGDPARVVGFGNTLLEKDLDGGNFLSLCLAAFDPRNGTLQYTSAGHDPPFVFRPEENTFAELESTGPLLGIMGGIDYDVSPPIPLKDGDILVFMTDGLFECMNAQDETFGKERLQTIIREHAAETSGAILDALLKGTADWTGNLPPRDDITVVVVKVGAEFGQAGGTE